MLLDENFYNRKDETFERMCIDLVIIFFYSDLKIYGILFIDALI